MKTNYLEQASRRIERYAVKYEDSPWKANFHFFFWSLTQLFRFRRKQMRPKQDEICRIAFELMGGIGDIILTLNYIQNFSRFLDVKHVIDLYVPSDPELCETMKILCCGQDFVRHLHSNRLRRGDYDLHIEIVRCPALLYVNRPKIAALSPKLLKWCDTNNQFQQENPLIYCHGGPGDYLSNRLAILQGRNRIQQADIGNLIGVEPTFRPKFFIDRQETLTKFGLIDTPFITLQRGVGDGVDRNYSTKLWPHEYYESLISQLRERFPQTKTVQVGAESSLLMQNADVDLRGKTSFEEVMVILTASRCHIDGECGLVHLRHFLDAGSGVVLFGPTDEHFFGYPENINLRSDVCPGGCEWITTNYFRQCVCGFEQNECLVRLSPEAVLGKVTEVLSR